MSYEVRGDILGFEETKKVEITEQDDLFSTMTDSNNKEISFTMVNPYSLREYSFDVPTDLRVILDINENSKINVYNIVVIQEPIEDSKVNFLAPIIVNEDNKTIGQAVLKKEKHPEFGMAETIKSFKE